MCSAHRLTERNMAVKFDENGPKGSGDIKLKFKGKSLDLDL